MFWGKIYIRGHHVFSRALQMKCCYNLHLLLFLVLGLVLKANRKYSQAIKKGFHVSQAALDVTNCSDEPVQVILTSENHNYILCTLRKNKVEQVSLDLNFAEGDTIAFTSQGKPNVVWLDGPFKAFKYVLVGNGNVHLSGYLIPESEEDMDFFGEEESENEEVENKPVKKKKQEKETNINSKKEAANAEDEDDDDEDDSDFDGSDEGDEEEDEVEGEDDDEVEDENESSSEEEEVTEPKPKQMKLETPKQNGLENGKVQSKEKQKKDKKEKKLKQQQQKQQQQEKTPKAGEKTLQGGVKVEDIRVGNGPEAKHGKKVQVYYEGRLKSNNKVFDSSKSGPGFKFGLGRGEVIKGWDIGVAGMKVGGKRRITCPPNMAYGNKGSPPVIPPNSTLVFEVELKGVN